MSTDNHNDNWLDMRSGLAELYNAHPLGALARVPPPPFMFDKFLRHRTLTLVSAEPFTGKTFFMLDMVLSGEFQTPLLGRFNPSGQITSLFIGQDSPDWDIGLQLRKLINGRGLTLEQAELSDSFVISAEEIRITDPAFCRWLEQWVKLTKCSVLYLDTLLNFHDADENSAREMGSVLRILKGMRAKLGISIVFAHHTSKPTMAGRSLNYEARGSSVIPGGVDYHIALRRRKASIVMDMAKGRGQRQSDLVSLPFQMEERPHPDPEGAIVLKTVEDPRIKFLLMHLTAGPKTNRTLINLATENWPHLTVLQVTHIVNNGLQALRRLGRAEPRDGLWYLTGV